MTGDQHKESREELEQQFRVFDERRQAAFNRNFETVKHLTTLSAGSVVLIGTFLQDIFPKGKGGELAVGAFTKWLIAGSFVLFGVSLIAASFFMYVFSGGFTLFPVSVRYDLSPGDEEEDEDEKSAPLALDKELSVNKELFEKSLMRTRAMIRWSFFAPFSSFIFGLFCFGLAVLITVL